MQINVADAPTIPDVFHGIWDVGPEACANPTGSLRTVIGKDGMSGWLNGIGPQPFFVSQFVKLRELDAIVSLDPVPEKKKVGFKDITLRFTVSDDRMLMFAEIVDPDDADHRSTQQKAWFYRRCDAEPSGGAR